MRKFDAVYLATVHQSPAALATTEGFSVVKSHALLRAHMFHFGTYENKASKLHNIPR